MKIAAETLQQRLHACVQRPVVDQLQQPASTRLAADEYVRGDIEVLEQVQFLMHKCNAGAERLLNGECIVLASLDHDRTRGRLDHAAKHFHERRFARTVLADQPDHLACVDGKRHVFQRAHRAIVLCDARQRKQGGIHRRLRESAAHRVTSCRARSSPAP
nr:hypothetical protein [Paraburkholderia franconis]